MKTLLIASVLSLSLILGGAVYAEQESNNSETSTTQQNGDEVEEKSDQTEQERRESSKKDRQEREAKLDELKAKRQAALEQRNAKKCEQVTLRADTLAQKLEGRIDHRSGRYRNLVEKLSNLSLRIENNTQADVADLSGQIAELSRLIADFETKAVAYRASVATISLTACTGEGEVLESVQT